VVAGVAVVELRVHESRSLKQKRGVLRSISSRVRNRFNVSVAEVAGQGTWQRAVLGISTCGAEPKVVRQVLEKVMDHVESLGLAEVVNSDIEILSLPLEEPLFLADEDPEDQPE